VESTQQVVRDPAFRHTAMTIAAEIASMPGLHSGVAAMEEVIPSAAALERKNKLAAHVRRASTTLRI
jgi:hypothetical protein